MRQTAKEYAAERVKDIAKRKRESLFNKDNKKPNLREHLVQASFEGKLEVKDSIEICELMDKKVQDVASDLDSFRRPTLTFVAEAIFKEPESYTIAVVRHQEQLKQNAAQRKEIDEYEQYLIDKLFLDQFQTGFEAIKGMESFSPGSAE